MKRFVGTIFLLYSLTFLGIQAKARLGDDEVQGKLTPPTTNITNGTVLTTSLVATHNTPADCWIIIKQQVYDVTNFLTAHPGNASTILPYCGLEATQAYDTKNIGRPHSAQSDSMLPEYLIGAIGSTYTGSSSTTTNSATNISNAANTSHTNTSVTNTAASPATTPSTVTLSQATVGAHASTSDCWMIMSGNVYNFTSYLFQHPGGAYVMTPYCGKDGTSAFATMGSRGRPHSAFARSLFSSYPLGKLGDTTTSTAITNSSVTAPNAFPFTENEEDD